MAVSKLTGYDTSTILLASTAVKNANDQALGGISLHTLAEKLTRWDAIYFTQAANRGAIFEQEWAFGWGFAKTLHTLSQTWPENYDEQVQAAVTGILISTLAHLMSVLLLYQLTKLVATCPASPQGLCMAFVSASLHIISPAGIFLMAPYAESCFSCLNFAGFYLYSLGAQYHHNEQHHFRDLSILVSSLCFGLATTFRSNGLLSGSLFCIELVGSFLKLKSDVQSSKLLSNLRRMMVLVIAGAAVSLGFLYPQYLAYEEYCLIPGHEDRPSWLSNAPLFLLAAPMLLIIVISSLWASPSYEDIERPPYKKEIRYHVPADKTWMSPLGIDTVRRLALPQLILAILALTSYHVQIISRISSGYPLWYWYLASKIVYRHSTPRAGFDVSAKVVVVWMVVYALLQASLFSAFLPPA
ncbi:MAG: hypothetical protein Q9218_003108 [Villophora microphyllina]